MELSELSVEDLAYDIISTPMPCYKRYIQIALEAFTPKKTLLREGQFNPHQDLDPFFQYLSQCEAFYFQRFGNNDGKGSLDNLSRSDVLAMYGRVRQIYDQSTGIWPIILLLPQARQASNMRRSLPDAQDIVDYIQENGPQL